MRILLTPAKTLLKSSDMSTEQAVNICAKLYRARDSMRSLYGADFQKKMEEFKGFIRLPLKWNKEAQMLCASLSDWLDDENVPIEWLCDLLSVIRSTPWLTWQLLTKRPQNWAPRVEECLKHIEAKPGWDQICEVPGDLELRNWLADWFVLKQPPENVWIGVSAGADQAAALDIPAKVHFLSCEPMLKPLDLSLWSGYYPLNETKSRDGEYRDGCSAQWTPDSKKGRDDLASEREASRPGYGSRISSDKDNDECGQGLRVLTPDSIPGILRRDSSVSDDQPQERKERGQQAGEFGTCDIPRADQACEESSRKTVQDSGRGEQRHGEAERGSSEGDSPQKSGWGTTEIYRSGVRSVGSEHQQDLPRPAVEGVFVIFGGESGKNARPCHLEWIRDGIAQCRRFGFPAFVKQLGANVFENMERIKLTDSHGGDMAEWPEDLRIREFPIE